MPFGKCNGFVMFVVNWWLEYAIGRKAPLSPASKPRNAFKYGTVIIIYTNFARKKSAFIRKNSPV